MNRSDRTQTPRTTSEPKLTLRKETLRDLSATELRRAAGGGAGFSAGYAQCLQ